MSRKFENKYNPRNVTIQVTNMETGIVYIHKDFDKSEISWISCNPNLQVEIFRKRSSEYFRGRKND